MLTFNFAIITGAAAAAKIYLESLSRVAKQAQQGTCGGTADIGNLITITLNFKSSTLHLSWIIFPIEQYFNFIFEEKKSLIIDT